MSGYRSPITSSPTYAQIYDPTSPKYVPSTPLAYDPELPYNDIISPYSTPKRPTSPYDPNLPLSNYNNVSPYSNPSSPKYNPINDNDIILLLDTNERGRVLKINNQDLVLDILDNQDNVVGMKTTKFSNIKKIK